MGIVFDVTDFKIGKDYLKPVEYPHEYNTSLEVQVWQFFSNMPEKTEIVYYSDLSDNLISGSFNYDSSSDIIANCNLEFLYSNNSELSVAPNKILWFDKIFKIYSVYKYPNDNIPDEKIFLGWFLPNKNSFVCDENNNSLTISCDDIMTLLMNTRCGAMLDWMENDNNFDNFCGLTIEATNYWNPQGKSVDSLIIKIFEQYKLPLNFDKNKIFPMMEYSHLGLPYDLEFDTNASVYDILKAFLNLYPNQRMYIDEDLNFVLSAYPATWIGLGRQNNYIYSRARDLSNIVISETKNNNLTDFYNYVVVLGKDGVAGQYGIHQGGHCMYCGSNYTKEEYEENMWCPYCLEEYVLKKPIQYISIDYPLSIEKIGIYKKAMSDDSLSTMQECRNLARWESFKSNHLINNTSISFLDCSAGNLFIKDGEILGIGKRIEYTSIITGETNIYLVEKLSYDASSSLWTAELSQFYPSQEEPLITMIGSPPSYVGHYDLKTPTFTYNLGENGLCTFYINNSDHTEYSLFKIYINDKFAGETCAESGSNKIFTYQFPSNNDYKVYMSAYNSNLPPSALSENQTITISNIITPKTVDNDPYPHIPIEIINAHAPRVLENNGSFITDENGNYILYT